MQTLEHVRFPEEAGVSSAGILSYIKAREEAGLEHHAIWVLRHGKVAAKLAWVLGLNSIENLLCLLIGYWLCHTAIGELRRIILCYRIAILIHRTHQTTIG